MAYYPESLIILIQNGLLKKHPYFYKYELKNVKN